MAAHEKSPSVAAHGAEEKQTREMLCAATPGPAPCVVVPRRMASLSGQTARMVEPSCAANVAPAVTALPS